MSEQTSDSNQTPGLGTSKKAAKKEEKKTKRENVTKKDSLDNFKGAVIYGSSSSAPKDNLKAILAAISSKLEFRFVKDSTNIHSINYPAATNQGKTIFGANAIVAYFQLIVKGDSPISPEVQDLLYWEEFELSPLLVKKSESTIELISTSLKKLESHASKLQGQSDTWILFALFPSLQEAFAIISPSSKTVENTWKDSSLQERYPLLFSVFSPISTSPELALAESILNGQIPPTPSTTNLPVVQAQLPADIDWKSAGLISSLRLIFDAAIVAAIPESQSLSLSAAVVIRCSNASFGDFQCNNPLALSKALKGLSGYSGPVAPKEIAERIISSLPKNPIVESATAAPNGFINIKVAISTIINSISSLVQHGVQPPKLPPLKVLVDFSSPNIAKEMHVGHLRSTIIGDCLSRLFEFIGYEVLRVNHVGDWGTQFGMLITYLVDEYPDILTNPPNITDLTLIYKESKKRFDADEVFKERSRKNVVSLQSGDPACHAIWRLLCDISRAEFEKVYQALQVHLQEFGESFYNPMIPAVIEELQGLGLVYEEEGMLLIKLPHFTIPLILRKSDGGYGYDSTDMAALKYRLFELKRDWIVIITDAGQSPHFQMCFDVARAAGWVDSSPSAVGTETKKKCRLDHIGFGLVCGEDGKRFKTRSSETVRLIDLLNAAKDRMLESLLQRAEEAKGSSGAASIPQEELAKTAENIGFGAVKYFDLKQHPSTNYIFNYDRMLDTKGDTAVYLLFAYARLASILRKALEERSIDISSFALESAHILSLEHPAERALGFELMQFGDIIKTVIDELLPNRLCDYLKELSVKFTDFVTKCHVLNATDLKLTHSRLLLCEATRKTMGKCFSLLGITPLERI